jgi:hypothetical protein
MLPFQPEEFGLSVRIDNRLAAQRVANGEATELFEIIELMAACRCLYDLATLASRELTTIQDCLALWSSMRDQFSGMCHAWEGIPMNGEATSVHRAELRRLRGLCEDRLGLYTISNRERRKHARERDAEIASYGERNGEEAAGYSTQSTPQHVYSHCRA